MKKYKRELIVGSNDSLSLVSTLIAPGSKVLDIGAGYGALGKFLTTSKSCIVDGLDITLPDENFQYYREFYINDLNLCNFSLDHNYDYIVLSDVIEHICNPEKVVEKFINLVNDDGFIILSVPNIAYIGVISSLLYNQFNYMESGILDKTHIKFYTKDSLSSFLDGLGLYTNEVLYVYKSLDHSEFRNFYLEKFGKDFINTLSEREDLYVYQYVIRASKKIRPDIISNSMKFEPYDHIEFFFKSIEEEHFNSINSIRYKFLSWKQCEQNISHKFTINKNTRCLRIDFGSRPKNILLIDIFLTYSSEKKIISAKKNKLNLKTTLCNDMIIGGNFLPINLTCTGDDPFIIIPPSFFDDLSDDEKVTLSIVLKPSLSYNFPIKS